MSRPYGWQTAYVAALKSGALLPAKGQTCRVCGVAARHLHHPDYQYPTWVIPVCDRCHRRIHGGSLMEPETGRWYIPRNAKTRLIEAICSCGSFQCPSWASNPSGRQVIASVADEDIVQRRSWGRWSTRRVALRLGRLARLRAEYPVISTPSAAHEGPPR